MKKTYQLLFHDDATKRTRFRMEIVFSLILCIFVFRPVPIFAQAVLPPGTAPSATAVTIRAQPLSPQAWSFMHYGSDTPNLYTGTVNMSIPLYTYKDADFEIPISATYASNGYNPNEPQGTMGLGWMLNVGGIITREIRGAVDDFEGHPGIQTFLIPPEISGNHYYGYYFRHKLNIPNSLQNAFDREKEDVGPWNPYFDFVNRKFYETESDIYSFNFLGHSGKFVLAPEQKIIVYGSNHPSGEYDIQLFTETLAYESTAVGGVEYTVRIYKICITTGDGYKYTFINRCDPDQIGNLTDEMYFGSTTHERYLTWYLSRIDSPSGRTVTFRYTEKKYMRFQPCIQEYGYSDSSDQIAKYDCNHYVYKYCNPIYNGNVNAPTYSDYQIYSIETDIGTIVFFHRAKPQQEFCDGSKLYRYQMLFTTDLLDKMTVKDKNNNVIDQHTFKYKYTQGNSIPLLDSLTFLDGRTYAMSYYHEDKIFPYYGVTYTDYGGYFSDYPNDPNYNIYRIREIKQTTSYTGTMYGMLKKIIYPTGGSSEFEYEQNTYSQIIVRRDENSAPYLTNTEGMNVVGAGVRIKKIIEKPTEDAVGTSKEYIYTQNNLSTGISLYYPNGMFTGEMENYAAETRGVQPIYIGNKQTDILKMKIKSK